CMQVLEFPFTF
nr:immunoglobulin light chain junction region [Macaca mulatta]MOX47655.1 immunoglobulin light chain junction region [Macaca mulatta]MOX47830.1 immunoglobulin light chain junction region [Macaca mulatta]MOX47904.1 immunoglobulin light chain junction region [Macaca mulatta]MOX47955.1 immunoglobulin light chain junction region [Macaca mulatta]